jgi:hypothetical protein
MLLRAGRASHATHAPWPRQLTLGAHFSRAGQPYRDRIRTMVLPDKQVCQFACHRAWWRVQYITDALAGGL